MNAFRGELEREARACGRRVEEVTVVGVSKRQPIAAVAAAIQAGLRDIGESYVQEALAKLALLPSARKHFIGHVQTNKAKAIAGAFDMVQSVDRIEAGRALGRAATNLGRPLDVLVQVNISPTERFGCPPGDVERLARVLRGVEGLRVCGVMAIGPQTDDRAALLAAFQLAANSLVRVGGTILSIGMSGDWREAVRAGSTMLRVGTAIFGQRAPR